jgi:hypothetical protein
MVMEAFLSVVAMSLKYRGTSRPAKQLDEVQSRKKAPLDAMMVKGEISTHIKC